MLLKKIHQSIQNKVHEIEDYFHSIDEFKEKTRDLESLVKELKKENAELTDKLQKHRVDMDIVISAVKELYIGVEQIMLQSNITTYTGDLYYCKDDDEEQGH